MDGESRKRAAITEWVTRDRQQRLASFSANITAKKLNLISSLTWTKYCTDCQLIRREEAYDEKDDAMHEKLSHRYELNSDESEDDEIHGFCEKYKQLSPYSYRRQ